MIEALDILIVDDNPDDRELCKRALKARLNGSLQFREAVNGESGLQSIADQQPSCVLLDYSLPKHNGIEVLKRLRSHYPFVPVVMLTGQGSEAVAVVAMREGAQNYISKSSITPESLERAIHSAMEHCLTQQRTYEQRTDLMRRIREYERLQEQLKENDRRKDEFLAMLAHELRNPIAPISNALNILKIKSLGRDVQEEAIAMASRQVGYMVRLLDDLLDVSRITHGKVLMHYNRTDLCDVIKTTLDAAKPFITEHEQHLETHVPHCPVWIRGDATRLAQLFGNLLNNASKYTPKGGTIVFDVVEGSRDITVRVKDNGIGIPKDKLPYIFDMFMQVDNTMERAQGGMGIGLTLVKNIAELHGGSVAVASEGQDHGTEFIVKLPILDTTQISSEKSQIEPPSLPDSYRILVVDDNKESAKTLGWMLETLGHKIKLAYTAKEALEVASSYKPRVILLDIGMPDMNGYDLCKLMRQDASFQNAIFIAQTGWGQEQHLQRSKEAGFDYHLIKPISFDALRHQLQSIRHH